MISIVLIWHGNLQCRKKDNYCVFLNFYAVGLFFFLLFLDKERAKEGEEREAVLAT